MRLAIPRRHRSAVITGVAVAAVVGLVGTIAVTSGGYASQRVDLGDAAVWVANEGAQSVGRASTAALELNSVVETGGRATIVQRGSTVLVLDVDRSSVGIVDAATSELTQPVAVPPEVTTLALAGSQVVLAADGDVWRTPLAEFAEFDAGTDAALSFGADAVISVDPAGLMFAVTPSTGEVVEVDAAGGATVSSEWRIERSTDHEVQITSAGGRWAVLDVETGMLALDGRRIDLSREIGSGGEVRLQAASSTAGEIWISTDRALLAVDSDTGAVRRASAERSGSPVAPVVVGGCVHAAWSGDGAWRSCDGAPGELFPLEGATGDDLDYLANGTALVLNDRGNGRTWAASREYQRIDNWRELLEVELDDQQLERNDPEDRPTIEKRSVDPVAEDDVFGARPGRSTLLPVLLNDYDANGDVLMIEQPEEQLPEWATLDLVSENQQLQLTLAAEATGVLRFSYRIGDGRGGSATADVEVTVRGIDENTAPEQRRPIQADVAVDGRLTTPVLGDWVDPDGDPVFLAESSVDAPDRVSWSAEGAVVFHEATGSTGERVVALVVSDGRAEASGTLEVTVHPAGEVPIVAEPFVALATAGEEIRIDPLRHVHGGTGQVALTAVPAKPEVEITPDYDGGTFRFSSTAVGTHHLEYTVSDGGAPVTGVVRVDVQPPPDRDPTPITVPHTAFLRVGDPADVDVLATDIDPTGGVLVITDAARDLEGVQIEIIEHRLLRVTLTGPLGSGSTSFAYRVSNGLAEAEGEVTLVQMPEPALAQPPVAADDTVSVRTGDVIDIPVLENDEHPDGIPLLLSPELASPPEDGLLFVSGDRLRYFAPETPGTYTATYRVEDERGQFANAAVSISVRESDPETNAVPVPEAVDARVIAGATVRIRIPLGGIDPDGDSVQLLGQQSNTELGTVEASGPDWLDYRAADYSAGTDTFAYAVIDALGARAEGTVRIGIAPRNERPAAPVAVEDVITVRPERTITVPVLDNDFDPAGGALEIVGVDPQGAGAARVVGDRVEVDVPAEEDEFGFSYIIENETLGRSSSFLTVIASEDAPLARPEASDTVLTLTDIVDAESVVVPVLRGVFLADGDERRLGVDLVDGYRRGAEVLDDGSIRVAVEDRRRIIPFVVSHPEDPEITAYAFVWVPGRDDALPQLRADAPDVEVRSGEAIELELADFVIAASGHPVRIADEASVLASHSDGSSLVVDRDTLRFRSEPGYSGPASISFTATDGESADDPDGRTGTVVIPIDVTSNEDEPPAFIGGVIDFEPGERKTIDLGRLTRSPGSTEPDDLDYEVLPPQAEGFDVELDGTDLTITARSETEFGTESFITIGVSDDTGEGSGGRIVLQVVPSTQPVARPADDTAIAARGRTTSIDVLANDEATNPFPDVPLRVVAVELGDLPAGVTISPSEDRSTLTVAVSQTAAAINTTIRYQVEDATGEPSRRAWAAVTVSVQDRPEPVVSPLLSGFGDGTLDIAFGAGAFNNSPISGYELVQIDPTSRDVLGRTVCETTSCTIATPGNGQANAVIVEIRARNGIGFSDPVTVPGTVWSDVVPPPADGLRALPRDGRLRLEWSPVSAGSGSPVGSYVVTVAGVATEVSAASACTASLCSVDSQSIPNGSRVPVAVSARNQAYPALATWTEATTAGTPFGAPIAGGIDVVGDAVAGTVTVTWAPFSGNGDAIAGYFVQRLVAGETAVPGGAQACSVTTPAPGSVVPPSTGGTVAETIGVGPDTSSVRFTGTATESTRYSFIVWGYNRAGCAHTGVAGTVVRPAPGGVGGVDSRMGWNGAETWDRYIDGVDSDASRLEIVAVDENGIQLPGSTREFRGSGWLRDLLNGRFDFGETGRFQVRGCSAWGSCGPWSDVLPAGSSPSLTFALPSRLWDDRAAAWSWTSPPDNSGLPATFSCGIEGDRGRRAQTPTSCQIAGVSAGDRVWLDVEVAGVTARYVATSKEPS
ncbi:Ig-like domain-containing protein [Agromyces lapidis]|uniref:Ig-like domain-containing protein n=1 Tax=Agromyces lapidis TaxID=279574 RepID=A0ABV5SQX7_9MICO|nr:Ig-like domain-containing protein [Agromyces lapidis]